MSSDKMRVVISRGKGLSVSLRGGYSRHWLAPDVPTELPDHIALAALQQGAEEVVSADIVPITPVTPAEEVPAENAALAAATEALEAASEVLDAAAEAVEAAAPRGNKSKKTD